MANSEVKRAIYVCNACHTCFEHDDVGDEVYDHCPLGPDTYSKKLTGEKLREHVKNHPKGKRYYGEPL